MKYAVLIALCLIAWQFDRHFDHQQAVKPNDASAAPLGMVN